jgi:hypothetical protein
METGARSGRVARAEELDIEATPRKLKVIIVTIVAF